MKLIINNAPKRFPDLANTDFDEKRISMDPDKRYAVAEIFCQELFVALKITGINGDVIEGDYVDCLEHFDDTPMLTSFRVDWSWLEYGFCKLRKWAPEMAHEHGGQFGYTAKRFYFDRELYKKRYEELNGVPYKKQKD